MASQIQRQLETIDGDWQGLLEAKNLTKRYGHITALESASFEVYTGVTGLLGPNGAGKSTAIKLFLGLIKPTSGSVTVMGLAPYESVTARTRLGYMPEHETLPSNISASEFLMHMAQVSGLPPGQARTRAADTLRHVGLSEERYRPIGGYSTGMRQRVKLAQALVHDPVLVLLDEPTAGLDPEGREEMLALINRTAKEFGISILLSTHLMGDVERTADRVIVLEGGQVTEQGAVDQYTQETKTLIIELEEGWEQVYRTLIERGIKVENKDNFLMVENAGDPEYDAIRDAIADAGARLRRLSPTRHTLTDIFRGER